MKKYNSIIFYYSVFIVTVVLIGSVFFLPRPFNIIQPIAFAPMFIFFWLKITSPEDATESSWSVRLILILFVLSSLGILGYYLAKQAPQADKTQKAENTLDPSASVSAELQALKNELKALREDEDNQKASESSSIDSTQIIDLLNSLNTNEPSSTATPQPNMIIKGYVKVNGSEAIDVYETDSIDAKIAGVALTGTKLPFFESKGAWYRVEYEKGMYGWIKASLVTETSSNI